MKKARSLLILINLIMVFALLLAACAPAATEAPVETDAAVEEPAEPAAPEEPEEVGEPEEEVVEVEVVAEVCSAGVIPPIDFIFSSASHDPIRNESGLLLTDEWESLGLTVITGPMDYSAYTAILDTGEGFNAYIAGYVSRPERLDPDVLLVRPFHSKGVNYSGYFSDEFDAIADAQRQEMDMDTRKELVFEAQEKLAEDAPAIALYHVSEIHAYNKDLWDNTVPMLGQGLWNFWNVTSMSPTTDETELKMGYVNELDTLNPYSDTDGSAVDPMRLVYDMLARVGPDGVPAPWAAESWEIIDDVTIQVNLREDMAFHDGVPVTAEDVKFSYDTQKEQGASIYLPFLEPINEIEIVDDYTLIFHLNNPYPPLYAATFSQIFILPKHFWEDIPDPKREYLAEDILGSGPYKFGHWRVGQEVKWEANTEHWQAPKADAFYEVFFDNPDAMVLALINSDIHMVDRRLLPAGVQQVRDVPYLEIVELDDFGVYYVGFNLRVPPFDDLAFRDAIGHTIDYDTIVNVLLEGNAVPGKGFIAPANTFWHNADQMVRDYDPDLARQLLAETGYEWDEDGNLCFPAE